MTAWYYSDTQRNRLGPVAAADLAALHEGGQLQPGTLVWREGLTEWKPWREVMAEVLGRPVAPAASPAPTLATAVADDGRARFAVPNDEPALAVATGYNPYQVVDRVPASPYAAPQAALTGAATVVYDGDVVYAGFWKRFAANVIDAFIAGLIGFVVQMVIGAFVFGGMAAMRTDPSRMFTGPMIVGLILMYLSPMAIAATYYGFMQASANQATLGKMAVGIKVVGEDGGPISFWRGFARYFGLMLSCIPLGIGVIMAGFTDRKRALHDMLCSTLVVDRWAFTAHPERQRPELGTVTIVILCIAGVILLGYITLFGTIMAMALRAAGGQ